MSEFNAGRQGPFPSGNREEAERAHEQDLREEAEHEHDVKAAEAPSGRWRWWPFGRWSR
jgi:hypothetical protein